MKRLICHGADAIFQVCKSFRSGEIGDQHNPEFTMIEWYRRDLSLVDQISFVEALVIDVHEFAVENSWLKMPEEMTFERLSYEEAFLQFAGCSALHSTTAELHSYAAQIGWQSNNVNASDRDDLLNFLLVMIVEPELAKIPAVSLYDYPASQAALAKIHTASPLVSDRFEMYLAGREICNGYQELTDPDELRRRMVQQNLKRIESGKSAFPVESQLLESMQSSPLSECSGVALGFDRLVMSCLERDSLADVIAFDFGQA